jgi:hypothetical protein
VIIAKIAIQVIKNLEIHSFSIKESSKAVDIKIVLQNYEKIYLRRTINFCIKREIAEYPKAQIASNFLNLSSRVKVSVITIDYRLTFYQYIKSSIVGEW